MLLGRNDLPPGTSAALRLLEIANLLALGRPDAVPAKWRELTALVAAQPEDFTVGRSVAGTAHFIAQAPALVAYRGGLLTLIEAIDDADRGAILAALENAESSFRQQP